MGRTKGSARGISSSVPRVKPVPDKIPESKVDEIWADTYHDQEAMVYTYGERPFSDGTFRLAGNRLLKPDLIVVPSLAYRLRGNFDTGATLKREATIAIVQENKKGNDLYHLANAMHDLLVYAEAAKQGILVDDTELRRPLVFAAGSYPSAKSPYFHDHEDKVMDDFHFYDLIPGFKQYAVGAFTLGAITISKRCLEPKVAFAYVNQGTGRPYLFIAPGEGYDISHRVGPLDKYFKPSTAAGVRGRLTGIGRSS